MLIKVKSSKLRKGSIIRLERYELNIIPNGKILVINQLSVIKNTIKKQPSQENSSLKNSASNDHKPIMNSNLAETLKSIGMIGSLKPTSNNSQVKQQQHQQQHQIQQKQKNLASTNNKKNKTKQVNNNNSNLLINRAKENETIDKAKTIKISNLNEINNSVENSKNVYLSNTRQNEHTECNMHEMVEKKFKQMLNNERKCLASSSSSSSTSPSAKTMFSSSSFDRQSQKITDKNNNKNKQTNSLTKYDNKIETINDDDKNSQLDELKKENEIYLSSVNKLSTSKKVS
jgi:hypothetical protein